MNIKAQCVFFENDGDTQMVGFADSETNPQAYVILQRTIRPTAQDIRLGLDQLYITVNDQSRSTYSGVSGISISSGAVVIRLRAEAARELKVDEDITIGIECAGPTMGDIKVNLDALVNGECAVKSVD